MRRFWSTFRAAALVAVLLAVLMPAGLYLALSTPWVQGRICALAASELSDLLGTEVTVGSVVYHPFNRLVVEDVHVKDDFGGEALSVEALNLRFELFRLLREREIEIDYVVIDGPELRVSRETADSPLNVAKIIERLKGDGRKRDKSSWRLAVSTLVVRRGAASYDVLSAECRDSVFDANHIRVSDLQLYACLPELSNEGYDVRLEHLSLAERSGFRLDDMRAVAVIDTAGVSLSDLRVVLPHSRVSGQLSAAVSLLSGDSALRGFTAELSDARLYLPDLAPFVPELAGIDRALELEAVAGGSQRAVTLSRLKFNDGRGVAGDISGEVARDDADRYKAGDVRVEVHAVGADVADILRMFPATSAGDALELLRRLGNVDLVLRGSGSGREIVASGDAVTGLGSVAFDVSAASDDGFKSLAFDAEADVKGFDAGALLAGDAVGSVSGHMAARGRASARDLSGTASAELSEIEARGYTYRGVTLHVDAGSLHDVSASLAVEDENARALLAMVYGKDGRRVSLTGNVRVSDTDLSALGLAKGRPGHILSGEAEWSVEGSDLDDAEAEVTVSDLSFADSGGNGITMKQLDATLRRDAADFTKAEMVLSSDFLSGTVYGRIAPSGLVTLFKQAVSSVAPALVDAPAGDAGVMNDFTFEFSLKNAEELSTFFDIPFHIIYPVDIDGRVDGGSKLFSVDVDAPYLQKGEDIIDNTSVNMVVDGGQGLARLYATTHMPTKKGPLAVALGVSGAGSRFDTLADWEIERKIPLRGRVDFSTLFEKGDDGLRTVVSINPSEITFGDDLWHLKPATVDVCGGKIEVDGFAMTAGGQSVSADGRVGDSIDDVLRARLSGLTLGDIFETLEIDKALIGGVATGDVEAAALLSKTPSITTDNLHVDDISYNYCVLGNADIRACFDNEKQSFYLDADVAEPDGRHSRIYGDIFPATESLDIKFDADHVKVGFMKPFMEAFASDVDGYASGHARLFGTFKYIDMEGDIFAQDLHLKIDFTNTWYEATDSIHIRPGVIDLEDVTIRDVNGHTAKLNGFVKHTFFKAPVFDFRITDARDFLSYNVGPKQSPDWYGTIYGNGGAAVTGAPGVVNIGVNMSTAPHSVFTFVLSDRLDADEYSFITFRDATPEEVSDTLTRVVDVPEAVLEFQRRMQSRNTDEPSAYNMDFRVDITPEAQMVIVMDPVGGDRIKANGSGNLRMTYNSTENDLRMYGTYALDRGSYNFTLQDIIIKDFTINDGSSITFRGDPYSAQLDIEAVYSVNANLSDLDESFLQDKELNRTNVPVHALMKVSGDMRQPDIGFDLEFPTLTSDTYRKVRSIISTDEMMNRQIIYLLALNRFYTPDYMASTTKGNELFSVASSTISSQLSSMLGKLSENWSIAPNLRSDRGDFSDVEVDLMLSSRLLNNRLLFNGNFGYRDKSLNTNQFIGDFDIEYLLNRRGTWRLKAYNRYNDQNYYVRTAQTTQGIGIVLKRDFDSMFSFLRRMKKTSATAPEAEPDSVPAQTGD